MHPILEELVNPEPPMRGEWSWRGRYRNAVYYKDPCWHCGCPVVRPLRYWSIDHLTPRAKDGWNDITTNLAGMCVPCNTSKGKLEPLQFLLMEVRIRRGLTLRHFGRRRRKKLRRMIGLLLAAA